LHLNDARQYDAPFVHSRYAGQPVDALPGIFRPYSANKKTCARAPPL
jgi:hypothetical protein